MLVCMHDCANNYILGSLLNSVAKPFMVIQQPCQGCCRWDLDLLYKSASHDIK